MVNVSLQVAGGCRLEVEIPVTVLHPASFYSALPTLFINRNSSGRVEYGGVIEDKKEVDEVLDAEEKEDELDRDALHQFGIKELSHEATVVRGPTALQPPNAPPAMPANSLFSSSHSPRKQRLVVSDQEEKIIERYGTVRLAPVPPSPQPPHPDSLPVAPVLLKRNNTLPRNHGNNQYAKPPPPPPPPAPPVMTFFPPPTPLEQAPVLIRRGKESIDAVIAHARQKHETAEKKLSAVTLTSAFGGNSDDDDEEVVVVDKEEQEEDEGEEEEMPVLHEVAGRKLLERQETLTNDRIRISAAKATSSGADKRKGLSLEDESLFQSLNAMLSNI